MQNLILVGMPGCGKSTLGVLLAKSLGYAFIDTDLIIQLQQKQPLQHIINEQGLDAFLRYEERALLSVKAKTSTVIATGGSAVFSQKGMEKLLETGVCVYINVPEDELKKRLTNIKTRGIAAQRGETISDIIAVRDPLYRKYSQYVIQSKGTPEEMVSRILYTVERSLEGRKQKAPKKPKKETVI